MFVGWLVGWLLFSQFTMSVALRPSYSCTGGCTRVLPPPVVCLNCQLPYNTSSVTV